MSKKTGSQGKGRSKPRQKGDSQVQATPNEASAGIQQYGPVVDAAIADAICEHLEESEKGLDRICNGNPSLVSARTFHRWLEASPVLRQRYARAKERQAEWIAHDAMRIADTPRMGIRKKTDTEGNVEIVEADMIEHRRLQYDARKWLAGKLDPKKWSDKLDITTGGDKLPASTHVILPNAEAGS